MTAQTNITRKLKKWHSLSKNYNFPHKTPELKEVFFFPRIIFQNSRASYDHGKKRTGEKQGYRQ